jgi:SAM-dependent methyltransferase
MKDDITEFNRRISVLRESLPGVDVFEQVLTDTGDHPENFVDFECAFAAEHLRQFNPRKILDIGSYRHFILGLLAHYDVTTVDVRPRRARISSETVITCDAKSLPLGDSSVDAVVSLCAMEHFGLGRYGDPFDPHADTLSLREMIRVLRPGGVCLLTTTITRGKPSVAFNAHRIYTLEWVYELTRGLTPADERFYSHRYNRECSYDEVMDIPRLWDVYCGCFKKE